MSLAVRCRAQYLTADVEMRSEDYDATHMVKAVKGLSLSARAYTWVTIDGERTKITDDNKDLAMDWFAEWAAQQIPAGDLATVLVPVPSSKTTLSSAVDFRTALIANRIATRRRNTVVAPVLRFENARPNSREEGGSRNAGELYLDMRITERLPMGRVVLVDDILTGGGHIKAASWVIEDEGRRVYQAICCGRSTDEQFPDPFDVPVEIVELDRNNVVDF